MSKTNRIKLLYIHICIVLYFFKCSLLSLVFSFLIHLESYFQLDFELRQKFPLRSITDKGTCDCIITNDQLVFTNFKHNSLLIHGINGCKQREIKLFSQPKFISVINDNIVAVSYNKACIEIINISTEKVTSRIVTRGIATGISYKEENMYVVFEYRKMDVMEMTAKKIVYSVNSRSQSASTRLLTDSGCLFRTNISNDALFGCYSFGSDKWGFTDDKMSDIFGVTTDGSGNIYVSCYKSNNVVVVSPDGKHHEVILTEKDGLLNPSGLYYDKSNDCLLVCSGGNDEAFLFDVKHLAKIE